MTLVITFYITLGLIVGLFLFRYIEERRQKIFFSRVREQLDRWVIYAFVRGGRLTCTQLKSMLKDSVARVSHALFYGILIAMRNIEKKLEKMMLAMRRAYMHQGKKGSARSRYLNSVGRGAKEVRGEE